jgi:hypothetical protein
MIPGFASSAAAAANNSEGDDETVPEGLVNCHVILLNFLTIGVAIIFFSFLSIIFARIFDWTGAK